MNILNTRCATNVKKINYFHMESYVMWMYQYIQRIEEQQSSRAILKFKLYVGNISQNKNFVLMFNKLKGAL